MGLDMSTYKKYPNTDDKTHELMYWRKHPNLHGWMEKLYREKGGEEEVFNCVELDLTPEDIDRLEKDLNSLPTTTGFFFGESHYADRKLDLQFIDNAREAFAEGATVHYNSWW